MCYEKEDEVMSGLDEIYGKELYVEKSLEGVKNLERTIVMEMH